MPPIIREIAGFDRRFEAVGDAWVEGTSLSTTIAGEDPEFDQLKISPHRAVITASYTRPADTTAYTAGDVLANSTTAPVPLTFTSAARFEGPGGRIVAAQIVDDSAPATAGDFELYLFKATAAGAAPAIQNDNAAWAPADADMLNCVGVISFGSTPKAGGANNRFYHATEGGGANGLPAHFKTVADVSADLYGIVVVRNAYTPASAGVLTFALHIEQD